MIKEEKLSNIYQIVKRTGFYYSVRSFMFLLLLLMCCFSSYHGKKNILG